MELNYEQVKKVLITRYPFLMIDKVTKLEKGKSLTAIKNVTGNEMYFVGHFPDQAVMPGVLIIEAAAQASAVLALVSRAGQSKEPGKMFFGAVNKMRFLAPVVPGDQLIIQVEALKLMSEAGITKVQIFVEDKAVAQGELMFSNPKA